MPHLQPVRDVALPELSTHKAGKSCLPRGYQDGLLQGRFRVIEIGHAHSLTKKFVLVNKVSCLGNLQNDL